MEFKITNLIKFAAYPYKMPQKNKNVNSLVIGKASKTKLSKLQLAFNKLTGKIKTLRKNIQSRTGLYDDLLNIYNADVFPVQQKTTALMSELIKILYEIYLKDKAISKTQKKTLKNVILYQIDMVFSSTYEHEGELKTIFDALSEEKYDAVRQEELELEIKEMKDLFARSGINLDMSDIGPEDDFNTVMSKLQQKLQDAQKEEKQRTHSQKKTKKQIAEEARQQELNEAREQSIKSIYRQLVKVLHPDLERDENLRLEKEALMKELTTAYKNNDLHTLLKLELDWIQHDSGHLETLTDQKLKMYNELLTEQANELEDELYLLDQQPRYTVLFEMGGPNLHLLLQKKDVLTQVSDSVQVSIRRLKAGAVKAEISEIIKFYKREMKMEKVREDWGFDDDDDDWY